MSPKHTVVTKRKTHRDNNIVMAHGFTRLATRRETGYTKTSLQRKLTSKS